MLLCAWENEQSALTYNRKVTKHIPSKLFAKQPKKK